MKSPISLPHALRPVVIPKLVDWLSVGALVAVIAAPLNEMALLMGTHSMRGRTIIGVLISLVFATAWAKSLRGPNYRWILYSCLAAFANATIAFALAQPRNIDELPAFAQAAAFGVFGVILWGPVTAFICLLFAWFERSASRRSLAAHGARAVELSVRKQRAGLYGVYGAILAGVVLALRHACTPGLFALLLGLCVLGAGAAIVPYVVVALRARTQRAFLAEVANGKDQDYGIANEAHGRRVLMQRVRPIVPADCYRELAPHDEPIADLVDSEVLYHAQT
jgi:hypothetical protein